MSADDAFSTWFAERVREFHADAPMPTSELVLDTGGMAGQTQ